MEDYLIPDGKEFDLIVWALKEYYNINKEKEIDDLLFRIHRAPIINKDEVPMVKSAINILIEEHKDDNYMGYIRQVLSLLPPWLY